LLNYAIKKSWKAGIQYNNIHRSNLSNPTLRFTDVPEHKVLATTMYQLKEKMSVMASAEYNSSRYSTNYGTKSGEFAIANISGRLKLYRSVSLEGGINNIFDKNYTLSEGFPEAGRNYFINLVFNNL